MINKLALDIFEFCKYKFIEEERRYIVQSLKQAYQQGVIDTLEEQLELLKRKVK